MVQDILFLCLVGVTFGQFVSFRDQQRFRSPSGVIGFDANGRITFQGTGGSIQSFRTNSNGGSQTFTIQSDSPFVPVLSRRAESQGVVEARQQIQQQLNLQESFARQQLQNQQNAFSSQQEQNANAQTQVQNILQEALARQQSRVIQNQAEQLIRQQTGPVSITIETQSTSVPFSNSIASGPSRGLGGILVANEQVSGKPCAARYSWTSKSIAYLLINEQDSTQKLFKVHIYRFKIN